MIYQAQTIQGLGVWVWHLDYGFKQHISCIHKINEILSLGSFSYCAIKIVGCQSISWGMASNHIHILNSEVHVISKIYSNYEHCSKYTWSQYLQFLKIAHTVYLSCCVAHIPSIVNLSKCGRVGVELCNRDDIYL